jgi:diguanylate cyclase (GGDEF)-like protein
VASICRPEHYDRLISAVHPATSVGLRAVRSGTGCRREGSVERLPDRPLNDVATEDLPVPREAGGSASLQDDLDPVSSRHSVRSGELTELPGIRTTALGSMTTLASSWLASRASDARGHSATIVSRPLPGGIPGLTYEELVRRYIELERVSRTDPLTGIPNRFHIDEQLAAHLSAARRHSQALSVLILDIDNFKRINDGFGHLAGDAVLREFTRRVTETLRVEDVVGRWGGEEFLVILPGTDADGALLLGERIRDRISVSPMSIAGLPPLFLTASGGIATAGDELPDDLLRAADEALYRAKRSGRNRIAQRATIPFAPSTLLAHAGGGAA